MGALNDDGAAPSGRIVSDRLRLRLLQQMAETLEDEAAGLHRRAGALEEEDSLLARDIEEHQVEINRQLSRLKALRAERDGLLERIETLRAEADAIREEVFSSEDELALEALSASSAYPPPDLEVDRPPRAPEEDRHNSPFFRRMTVMDLLE